MSRILIIGINGVTNEVAKNLVLAGVGELVLLDHVTVSEQHLGAQFLLPESSINRNVRCGLV